MIAMRSPGQISHDAPYKATTAFRPDP